MSLFVVESDNPQQVSSMILNALTMNPTSYAILFQLTQENVVETSIRHVGDSSSNTDSAHSDDLSLLNPASAQSEASPHLLSNPPPQTPNDQQRSKRVIQINSMLFSYQLHGIGRKQMLPVTIRLDHQPLPKQDSFPVFGIILDEMVFLENWNTYIGHIISSKYFLYE